MQVFVDFLQDPNFENNVLFAIKAGQTVTLYIYIKSILIQRNLVHLIDNVNASLIESLQMIFIVTSSFQFNEVSM